MKLGYFQVISPIVIRLIERRDAGRKRSRHFGKGVKVTTIDDRPGEEERCQSRP